MTFELLSVGRPKIIRTGELDAVLSLGLAVRRDHEVGLDLELGVEHDELGVIAAGAMNVECDLVRHASAERGQYPPPSRTYRRACCRHR
jgi:hypothetical protein